MSPATSAERARRVLVEESAAAIGRTWAIGCRSTLRREGRPASGGWPGTIREARLLVGQALPTAMTQGRNAPVITEAERELAARAAYASARAEWLRHAEAETP